jgi:DNA-binding NtrC family response regulator
MWKFIEPNNSRRITSPLKSDPKTESEALEEIGEGRLFVAFSPVMRTLRAQAELLSRVNVPVLVVGERGSGKESIARLITNF